MIHVKKKKKKLLTEFFLFFLILVASYYEMNTVLRFYYSETFVAVSSTGNSLRVLFQQCSDEDISETDDTTALECNKIVLTGGKRGQVP